MRAQHVALGVLALAIATTAIAQTAAAQGSTARPRVVNGQLTAQAGANLDATFRRLVAAQSDPAWIGYAVPTTPTDPNRGSSLRGDTWISDGVVFTNGRLATCGLESSSTSRRSDAPVQTQNPVRLEGPDSVMVLYRVEAKAVQRIRVVSPDCELDAGGRTVQWLEGVNPAESVRLLATFVSRAEMKSDRLSDGAISAIALHRDEAADTALERLGGRDNPEFVRKKVTFWLGNARGQHGFQTLQRVLRDDPSVEVRKSAIFGLTQSKVPQALDTLIATARTDAEPRLRGEALFWLAQKAGEKAAATITDRIDQDPDTEVKKKAVFALSQLPKDEGVPLLIKVARSNTNPEVRKQAMFWLGQSKDPRATDFFAEVLGK